MSTQHILWTWVDSLIYRMFVWFQWFPGCWKCVITLEPWSHDVSCHHFCRGVSRCFEGEEHWNHECPFSWISWSWFGSIPSKEVWVPRYISNFEANSSCTLISVTKWWQLKYFLYFHPWGNDPIWLAHIFQMGWFNSTTTLVTSYYSNVTLGKVLLPWWLNCAAAVVLGMKAVSAGFLASFSWNGTIAGETTWKMVNPKYDCKRSYRCWLLSSFNWTRLFWLHI